MSIIRRPIAEPEVRKAAREQFISANNACELHRSFGRAVPAALVDRLKNASRTLIKIYPEMLGAKR